MEYLKYLLLVVSLSFSVTRSLLLKKVKRKSPFFEEVRLNVMFFFVGMLAILPFVVSAFDNISVQPLHLSAIYGLLLMAGLICTLEAMARGSLSLTVFFGQCGFLIPTVFNALYFKESVSIVTAAGIVLIVVSLVLTIDRKGFKFSYSWLIFAVSGLICSGLIGIDQKFLAVYYPQAKQTLFADFSLAFAVLFGLIAMLVTFLKNRKKQPESAFESSTAAIAADNAQGPAAIATSSKGEKLRMVFIVAIGIFYGVINVLNTYLSGALPSVVFFPVYNVGVIVSVTVVSALVYKDKLSVKQIISIVLGSLAIVVIAVGRIV
ncbi:MAG: hypothetical protein J5762_03535 [Clostridia bacterium]|nr:hypothetical protein [Clostridia bacterium]